VEGYAFVKLVEIKTIPFIINNEIDKKREAYFLRSIHEGTANMSRTTFGFSILARSSAIFCCASAPVSFTMPQSLFLFFINLAVAVFKLVSVGAETIRKAL
jgi:hypothetical protein